MKKETKGYTIAIIIILPIIGLFLFLVGQSLYKSITFDSNYKKTQETTASYISEEVVGITEEENTISIPYKYGALARGIINSESNHKMTLIEAVQLIIDTEGYKYIPEKQGELTPAKLVK